MVLQKIFRQIVHHLEKKVRFIKRDWVVSTGSIFIRQDVTKTDQILHHTVYGFANLRFLCTIGISTVPIFVFKNFDREYRIVASSNARY